MLIRDNAVCKGMVGRMGYLGDIFIRAVSDRPLLGDKFENTHHEPVIFLTVYFQADGLPWRETWKFFKDAFAELTGHRRSQDGNGIGSRTIRVQGLSAGISPTFHRYHTGHLHGSVFHFVKTIGLVKVQGHIGQEVFTDLINVIMEGYTHIEHGNKYGPAHGQCKQSQDQPVPAAEGIAQ